MKHGRTVAGFVDQMWTPLGLLTFSWCRTKRINFDMQKHFNENQEVPKIPLLVEFTATPFTSAHLGNGVVYGHVGKRLPFKSVRIDNAVLFDPTRLKIVKILCALVWTL
eukprot:Gb_02933 [translate_table: standard]